MFFDPLYFLILSPALILMVWAQARIKSTYHKAMRVRAPLSGAAAAQHILQSSGIYDVSIEPTRGFLSDHYDPRHKVLRLSPEVYQGQSAAAVGIAAHEAGHAIQDAKHYLPLVVRNAAVPAAQVGPTVSIVLLLLGFFLGFPPLVKLGIIAFGAIVFFQVVNLPVEIDASNRAKQLLGELGIVDNEGAAAVRSVLNAAAWTYVAATLQSILTLLYYIMRFGGGSRN
jgi:uncharacterized protein